MITVCSSAAGETCPAYLGPVLRTHWGVDDPAHATGTDAEIDAHSAAPTGRCVTASRRSWRCRWTTLKRDRAQLKAAMDRIGATVTEETNMSAQCEVTAKRAARRR